MRLDRLVCKARGGHVVVDAPAGVVVEGLAAVGPPGVGALRVAGQLTGHILVAHLAEEAVEVGDFLVHHAGALIVVRLPVLDVLLGVHDVQVAHHQHMVLFRSQRRQVLGHALQEAVLVLLLLGAQFARVHIAGDHGEDFAVYVEVSLHPAAGIGEVLITDVLAHRHRLNAGEHSHSGAALILGFGMQNMPTIADQFAQHLVRCAHLLQAQDVDVAGFNPLRHVLAVGGANAVDVDRGDAQGAGVLAQNFHAGWYHHSTLQNSRADYALKPTRRGRNTVLYAGMVTTLPAEVRTALFGYLKAADVLAPGAITHAALAGSLALGDYRPGASDIDLIAVVDDSWRGRALLPRLRALHLSQLPRLALRALRGLGFSACCNVSFIWAGEMGTPVTEISPIASHTGEQFCASRAFDVNPVIFTEALSGSLVVRGPSISEWKMNPQPELLRSFTLQNLQDYWEPLMRRNIGRELRPSQVAWCVSGTARMHATITTGQILSKRAALIHAAVEFSDHAQIIDLAMAQLNGRKPRGFAGAGAQSAALMRQVFDSVS